ncbi:MAG TPA: LptF/LptG family permease, partial [Gemmataceae bacterium]|nr:LptF/LptG family permease [Gemmataceae bacterium]
MKLLDRQMIYAYLKAYLICLVSLLSLYIVVDLFTNMEDFTGHHRRVWAVLQHIGTYYGYKVTQIFDRLCEAIVLLAAMFTVAWMQRHNELLPLLSAGVPTRRVIRPVLLAACTMLGLSVLNQEFIIPRIATYLLAERQDPLNEKEFAVQQAGFEPNGIHIDGRIALRRDHLMAIKGFYCTIPPGLSRDLVHLEAEEARYIPPGAGPRTGGWLLTNTTPAQLDNWDNTALVEMIDPGKYFLHTQLVDFETLTRREKWYMFASTWRLREELEQTDSTRLAAMAVQFHMRLTRPILGIL